jgi:hypothetical protein
MGVLEWEFSGAPPVPQEPYKGVAAKVPGKIEIENFDEGGARKAYSDDDSENQGDADFRTEEGVDLVKAGDGIAVGYTAAGEWMEYTVNVADGAEKIWTARVASGSETSSFQLFLDDEAISDTIQVPQTDTTWNVYTQIEGDLKSLPAGEHVLKLLITGSYVNIDWIALGEEVTTPLLANPVQSLNPENLDSDVFDLRGNRVGASLVNVRPGVYIVRQGSQTKTVVVRK